MPRGRRDEYYERDDTGCTIDEDEQEDVAETVRGGQARRRSPSRNAFSQRRGEDFDDRDYSDYRDRRDYRDRPESRHFPDDRDRPGDRDDPDPDGRGWFHAAHYEGDDDDLRSDPTVPARYRATRQEREAVHADDRPSIHTWQEDEEDKSPRERCGTLSARRVGWLAMRCSMRGPARRCREGIRAGSQREVWCRRAGGG